MRDLWFSYDEIRPPDPVRFLLVGQRCCGAEVVREALNVHRDARCYGELLHENADIRRKLHTGYFGESGDSGVPDWFVDGVTNPERYLATKVFDHPLNKEEVYGLQVSYGDIRRLDLWDYFKERCNMGDFCVIHVLRGPIPCFDAVHAGKGSLLVDGDSDSEDLIRFVQDHEADLRKLRDVCGDAFELEYRELISNGDEVMRKMFEFLELPNKHLRRVKGVLQAGIRKMANNNRTYKAVTKMPTSSGSMPAWMAEYFERANLI
jgi:hypothetical protein